MEIAIDYPDEVIHWFTSYPEAERIRRAVGDCPHACEHQLTKTVGWGPDLQRYELHVCNDDCGGNCRGWMAAVGATSYELHRRIRWKLLDEDAR